MQFPKSPTLGLVILYLLVTQIMEQKLHLLNWQPTSLMGLQIILEDKKENWTRGLRKKIICKTLHVGRSQHQKYWVAKEEIP